MGNHWISKFKPRNPGSLKTNTGPIWFTFWEYRHRLTSYLLSPSVTQTLSFGTSTHNHFLQTHIGKPPAPHTPTPPPHRHPTPCFCWRKNCHLIPTPLRFRFAHLHQIRASGGVPSRNNRNARNSLNTRSTKSDRTPWWQSRMVLVSVWDLQPYTWGNMASPRKQILKNSKQEQWNNTKTVECKISSNQKTKFLKMQIKRRYNTIETSTQQIKTNKQKQWEKECVLEVLGIHWILRVLGVRSRSTRSAPYSLYGLSLFVPSDVVTKKYQNRLVQDH